MSLAITGAGMITSIGRNKTECFEAFCNGISGNKPLQAFPHEKFKANRAYEIADRKQTGEDCKLRSTSWLCAAINEAIRSANLTDSAARISVIVGTGLRELRSLELWWVDGESLEAHELHFGKAVKAHIDHRCQVLTLSNACAASNFALGLATDMLEHDECDVAIVAGCDSITESMYGILDRVNHKIPEICQPFDENRKGIIMGEGAAAVVVEKADRGVPVMARLLAVGISSDAFNETAPDKDGIIQSIADAHVRAGIGPEDIDLMMIHGTGTMLNDITEARAINEYFGDSAKRILITGLKSMIGHTSGASGLIGVVTAIECLRRGLVPPTMNFETPMEEARRMQIVVREALPADLQIAQVNAFGFGGVNAVVLLGKE